MGGGREREEDDDLRGAARGFIPPSGRTLRIVP